MLYARDANWMQGLTKPLPENYINPSDITSLDSPQFVRVSFYLALIRLTRLVSGSITVAIPTSTPSNPNPSPSAALLWLPPHAWPSIFSLYRSSFLYAMLVQYGFKAIWNLGNFERDLEALNISVLSPLGYKKQACGFPFLIAADPTFRGKGYGAKLLDRQIEKHKLEFPYIPVVLDTTTDQAQRFYERIGFRLLGTAAVETGTDHEGIKVESGTQAGKFSKRVLILLPQLPEG